jgi:hypothetical protein
MTISKKSMQKQPLSSLSLQYSTTACEAREYSNNASLRARLVYVGARQVSVSQPPVAMFSSFAELRHKTRSDNFNLNHMSICFAATLQTQISCTTSIRCKQTQSTESDARAQFVLSPSLRNSGQHISVFSWRVAGHVRSIDLFGSRGNGLVQWMSSDFRI